MSRPTYSFVVDTLLFVIFLALIWTSALVQFVFPPGTQATGWTLWGLSYDDWCRIQAVCIALFTLNVLVHLILGWNWVCSFIHSRLNRGKKERVPDGIKTLYGVGTLVTILTVLGVMLAVAEIMVRQPRPNG